ncbi:putative tail protein [Proteus phage vB_PmiM_ZX7]|nr:putative tail protein [Proteus phage vB_PmiM_ZX7]
MYNIETFTTEDIKMAYIPTNWENSPSTNTPLNADNLNKLEQGVKALHDALDSGELKGDIGPQGPQGLQGPAGKDGKDGAKGEKGDPGVFDVDSLTEDDIAALKLKLGIS